TAMDGWLLVEHPGAWPANVVDRVLNRALSPARRHELAELRAAKALRPLLIRRPGRRQPMVGNVSGGVGINVMIGGAGAGRTWLEALELDDLGQLDRLDLRAI